MSAPALVRAAPAVDAAPPAARFRARRWLPAGLLTLATVAVLRHYGVNPFTSAAFLAYLLLGIVLPGTLVWRATHGGTGWFAADVAAGTALGYAGEVFAYIPARALGLPLLVLVWPLGTAAAFLLVPGLRRHWRGPRVEPIPGRWAWLLSAAIGAVVFWSCKFFRVYGMSWPGYAAPDTDSPFHLALIGEAKHHLPMTSPWISGEPLLYHWFVYADLAATSWVSGIEPQVLLLRLAMLPMLAGFAVLIAALGRRLGGSWLAGGLAVIGTLFVLGPNPYGWRLDPFYTGLAFGPVDDGSALRLTVWTSPSQTFGALLFAALMLALVDVLALGGARRWAVFAVLLPAVMGAKATYLPLLLAGLVATTSAKVWHWRRQTATTSDNVWQRAGVAAGMTLAALLFAQFVLFGRATQGLGWAPLADVRTAAINTTLFLADPRPERLALVTALAVWSWCCIWAGCSGLLRASGPPCDLPGRSMCGLPTALLLGIGAAGIGATMLLGQSGDSQRFFLESARPYLTLAAVCGLVRVLRRPSAGLLGAAAAVGVAAIGLIRHLDGPVLPLPGRGNLAFALAWPYAATVALAAGAAIGLALARRRYAILRGTTHGLVIALLAGFGLASTASNLGHVLRDPPANKPIITAGTLEAGRWLRDHSDPGDLVATNAHCLPGPPAHCVNLHFAVSAYTERRVLVEGWGFTAHAHERAAALGVWVGAVPYWRPDVLAANDAAFTTPSVETLNRLRDRYGVRWLFVDETAGASGELWRFAELRYRAGRCAIYLVLRPGERT